MDRIHRYGQEHDPVVIVKSGGRRHARGTGAEDPARQAGGDPTAAPVGQVFDVVGRLFEGVSVRDYLEQAVTEGGDGAAERLDGAASPTSR